MDCLTNRRASNFTAYRLSTGVPHPSTNHEPRVPMESPPDSGRAATSRQLGSHPHLPGLCSLLKTLTLCLALVWVLVQILWLAGNEKGAPATAKPPPEMYAHDIDIHRNEAIELLKEEIRELRHRELMLQHTHNETMNALRLKESSRVSDEAAGEHHREERMREMRGQIALLEERMMQMASRLAEKDANVAELEKALHAADFSPPAPAAREEEDDVLVNAASARLGARIITSASTQPQHSPWLLNLVKSTGLHTLSRYGPTLNQELRDISIVISEEPIHGPGDAYVYHAEEVRIAIQLAFPVLPRSVIVEHVNPKIDRFKDCAPEFVRIEGSKREGGFLWSKEASLDLRRVPSRNTIELDDKILPLTDVVRLIFTKSRNGENLCVYRIRVMGEVDGM